MADNIVFIVQNKSKEQNREASIKLFTDATVNIEHSFENDVTSFPVERGADITDNIRVRNNKFTVAGVVSDYTLSQYQGNAVGYTAGADRRQQMFDQLLSLRNNKQRFTLVTGFDAFEGCVVKSFSVPVTPENANSFTFSMDIEQIREVFVDTVDIVIPSVRQDKKDDVSTTGNKGGNQTKEESVTSRLSDIFKRAFEAFKDTGTKDTGTGGS